MSGECEFCEEHTVDCMCDKKDKVYSVDLEDRCDKILSLLDCLILILSDKQGAYQSFTHKPHLDLILHIEDLIKDIRKDLDKL